MLCALEFAVTAFVNETKFVRRPVVMDGSSESIYQDYIWRENAVANVSDGYFVVACDIFFSSSFPIAL